METAIFNMNDLTVLFTGLFALIISVMLALQSRRGNTLRNLILAAFFLQSTLFSANILMYWNVNLNALLSSMSANFFFTLGFCELLQGPLLYWSTRAVVYRDFHLGRTDFLHLIPALAYPFFLAAVYYRLGEAAKLQLVHSWTQVNANPYFMGMIWAQKLSFFGYNLACLFELRRYEAHCRNSGVEDKPDIRWLKVLAYGFFAVNTWRLLVLLVTINSYVSWGYAMGTIENYFRMLMQGGMLAYLLRNTIGFPAAAIEPVAAQTVAPDALELHLLKLRKLMESEKPYLQPNINLERLALRLEISPKLLSNIINKKLNQNFFEMIRNYRIDEARRRLGDETYRLQSINDIMQECGFNSKSVFNQWFKERFGKTPSQYRRQHLG